MTPPSSFRQLHQDPHLSPTCVRNLVKRLATSPSKHSMNPAPNPTRRGTVSDASLAPNSTHRQPHKRQIRRRLHTARPYQDRLLDMAEARKEIVTALKFHRASMKRQQTKQPQNPPTVPLLHLQHPCLEQDAGIMSHTNHPRIYPSCTCSFSNPFSSFSHPTLSVLNPLNPPAASPVPPPPISYSLPSRALGLNLNSHNFDLDNNASFYSYPSPSSSSPSQGEETSAPADAIDSMAASQLAGCEHTARGNEGMAEIGSSALWPKFVKNMEHQTTEDDAAYPVFDGPEEFPDWLNANERCFEQCSEEYASDPTLPW